MSSNDATPPPPLLNAPPPIPTITLRYSSSSESMESEAEPERMEIGNPKESAPATPTQGWLRAGHRPAATTATSKPTTAATTTTTKSTTTAAATTKSTAAAASPAPSFSWTVELEQTEEPRIRSREPMNEQERRMVAKAAQYERQREARKKRLQSERQKRPPLSAAEAAALLPLSHIEAKKFPPVRPFVYEATPSPLELREQEKVLAASMRTPEARPLSMLLLHASSEDELDRVEADLVVLQGQLQQRRQALGLSAPPGNVELPRPSSTTTTTTTTTFSSKSPISLVPPERTTVTATGLQVGDMVSFMDTLVSTGGGVSKRTGMQTLQRTGILQLVEKDHGRPVATVRVPTAEHIQDLAEYESVRVPEAQLNLVRTAQQLQWDRDRLAAAERRRTEKLSAEKKMKNRPQPPVIVLSSSSETEMEDDSQATEEDR